MIVEPEDRTSDTDPRPALGRWLWFVVVAATLATVFAHGCHPGDHGDADLLTRLWR